ncbi:sulfatase family protein [Calycomorphotria hydatis]|uniref:Arylsulfatase n=1 Tax=Calycomorphotria hydatis TaxID=2528027 RepID=A0A517TB27_9PLAN|nr:sulfatase [Calycomorphotria hydatis]QDT65579.1 Arylsulfatase [Calycomorphotria hydatis]
MFRLAFFAFVIAVVPVTGWSDERPNVIVFIADDVNWNDYGCYGNEAARTPNIDQLAETGLRFDNAYLTASSCSPSRSSIMTGRYPHNNGTASELHRPLPANLDTFPHLLREAGYYTALSGKNHVSQEGSTAPGQRVDNSFDHFDNGRQPGESGGEANWISVLQDRPKEKPFFFWYAAYDAHRPWDGDKQWKEDRYGPKHRPEDVIVPAFLVDNEETRQDLASYYNEVTRFDWYIGQVVKELKKQGVYENTLLFVLADNGRPFPRAKTRVHDSGMKTGFVAHWPKGIQQPGEAVEGLISVIDIAPTVLELAGAESDEQFQGVSFSKLFANPETTTRQYVFSEHNWHDYEAHGRSVRDTDGFLYVRNSRPETAWQGPADSVSSPSFQALRHQRDSGQLTIAQQDVFLAPRPGEELYDSNKDPEQLNSIVNSEAQAGRLTRLRGVMDQWQRETGDSVPENYSRDYFDRETGDRIKGVKREEIWHDPAGFEHDAHLINKKGPY